MKNFKKTLISCVALSVLAATVWVVSGTSPFSAPPKTSFDKHFHPSGKLPSSHTLEIRKQVKASLPFEDTRDLEEAKRGFIAAPDFKQIIAEDGHVAWDMESYEFLLEDKDYESIHPSLRRQAYLNMAYGLYEVLPNRIYQVRGFDLANITFVRGDTGWIIFDPLTSKETSRAALDFINEKIEKLPVVAVVYSHSHADHFGGVRGVIDEADVISGKVKLVAPAGFMQHAVSENVYAGNAMTRRVQFQYGVLLNRSPFGHVDQAIGKNVSSGNLGLIKPNVIIEKPIEEMTIDGIKMVFQNTPNTEAPAEINTWFPDLKAFWGAENVTGTVHNIYTLRGAMVRDALNWSKYINEALYMFGQDAEVMFASHNWPRWGNSRIQEVLRAQRDAYGNLNNQVLHLANQGVTINEIHNVYKVPESLQRQWAARSYHGSEFHNSRGVLNRYLGYWDGNPTNLVPLSPKESAPLYVEMMGGSEKILAKGTELIDAGKYLEATEILNKLVFAEPDNTVAKNLLADAFEQIGYQKESTSLRNSFLAAAYELRSGLPEGIPPSASGPDLIRAVPTEMWLDYLAIRMDARKAEGVNFVINLITPDNGEKFVIELSNATLTNIKGFLSKNPTMTLTINRSDLNTLLLDPNVTLESIIESGRAKVDGDIKPLKLLEGMMIQFTPDFEIMPGTARHEKKVNQEKNPFRQPEPANTAGQ